MGRASLPAQAEAQPAAAATTLRRTAVLVRQDARAPGGHLVLSWPKDPQKATVVLSEEQAHRLLGAFTTAAR